MRDNTIVEVKYGSNTNESEPDNRHLDESKEEETPVAQIAKIVEKNGKIDS